MNHHLNDFTMKTENCFVHNLETGKLNIYTTKEFYDQLAEDQRKIFKQYCLWSRKQECWISKGKAENCYYLKNRLKELGFSDKGSTGQRLSFEEHVKLEQEKAAIRAERSELVLEKLSRSLKNFTTRQRKWPRSSRSGNRFWWVTIRSSGTAIIATGFTTLSGKPLLSRTKPLITTARPKMQGKRLKARNIPIPSIWGKRSGNARNTFVCLKGA